MGLKEQHNGAQSGQEVETGEERELAQTPQEVFALLAMKTLPLNPSHCSWEERISPLD